jgi:hypothetical protein
MKKFPIAKHQRSNNDSMPEFESLLCDNLPESNIATERHSSSLIENFDKSEFIKNVIIQSKKLGGNRFGSPGQSNQNSQTQQPQKEPSNDKNFMKDRTKHGILKAFNDINKFSEFFENSPTCNQDSIESKRKK